ncbi:MAG: hypothetical protein HAW67_08445 [Endozoicomonadaceae bacterium]|nr:hypothetical protein [Endozoicomonadaceae bacterium]
MPQPNIKHLEFTQAVITRMNTNSFQIKGWTITLVAALLAIFASTKNELFVLVSLLPVTLFWGLDSYYLVQERKFRGIYNDIAGLTPDPITSKEFEMRPDLYVGKKYSYFNVFTSSTILMLYLSLFVLLLSTYIFLLTCNK